MTNFYQYSKERFGQLYAHELRTGDILALGNDPGNLYGELPLETVIQTPDTTIVYYRLPKGASITSTPLCEVRVNKSRSLIEVKQEFSQNTLLFGRKN